MNLSFDNKESFMESARTFDPSNGLDLRTLGELQCREGTCELAGGCDSVGEFPNEESASGNVSPAKEKEKEILF